jgi:hypothetical protein
MQGHQQTKAEIPSTSASSDDFLVRLGLAYNCSESDVRDAYLRLANDLHPDHGGNAEFFRQLRNDYERALHYARHQRAPQVHDFFLSPWNATAIQTQRRQAIMGLLRLLAMVAIGSVATWLLTQNLIVPSTIIAIFLAACHMCLMASFRPTVSFVGIIVSLIVLTFAVAIVAGEGLFTRPWDHYASFNDFSPGEQLQLGLLTFVGLLLPASIMGWVVSLTEQGID